MPNKKKMKVAVIVPCRCSTVSRPCLISSWPEKYSDGGRV